MMIEAKSFYFHTYRLTIAEQFPAFTVFTTQRVCVCVCLLHWLNPFLTD